jgi:hypothetical protein
VVEGFVEFELGVECLGDGGSGGTGGGRERRLWRWAGEVPLGDVGEGGCLVGDLEDVVCGGGRGCSELELGDGRSNAGSGRGRWT